MNTTIAPLTPTTIAEITAALDEKRSERQNRPAPIQPLSHKELKARAAEVKIPTIEEIILNEASVSRLAFKFNVGGNADNIPSGVRKKEFNMNATARMAHNLESAAKIGGEELTERNRIPGRPYDTALGILGGKNVKQLSVGPAMRNMEKAGFKLVDVNSQMSGGNNFIVAFEFARTVPETTFPHCEEKLARQLIERFAKATSQQTTVFWNPNKTVTVNVGPYCPARAKKVLVVDSNGGFPALKLEDVPPAK